MEEEDEPPGKSHIQAVKEFHARIAELRKKDCMCFYTPKLTCRQRLEIWLAKGLPAKTLAERYGIHPANAGVIKNSPRPQLCEKHKRPG